MIAWLKARLGLSKPLVIEQPRPVRVLRGRYRPDAAWPY